MNTRVSWTVKRPLVMSLLTYKSFLPLDQSKIVPGLETISKLQICIIQNKGYLTYTEVL